MKYIVGIRDTQLEEIEFAIVEAENEEDAIIKYIVEVDSQESIFIDHLYGRSVNMSFAEAFFFQSSQESEDFSMSGDVSIDEDEFKRRVRVFFKDKQEFADMYLKHWYSKEDDDLKTGITFPDDMILYMTLKTDGMESYTAIPFTSITQI